MACGHLLVVTMPREPRNSLSGWSARREIDSPAPASRCLALARAVLIGPGALAGSGAHRGHRDGAVGCQRRNRLRSELLESRHWTVGYVAASAEAAAISGLADSYAVVDLFRRSLPRSSPAYRDHFEQSAAHRRKFGDFVRAVSCAPDPIEQKTEVRRLRCGGRRTGSPTRNGACHCRDSRCGSCASVVRRRGNWAAVIHGATRRRTDRGSRSGPSCRQADVRLRRRPATPAPYSTKFSPGSIGFCKTKKRRRRFERKYAGNCHRYSICFAPTPTCCGD